MLNGLYPETGCSEPSGLTLHASEKEPIPSIMAMFLRGTHHCGSIIVLGKVVLSN